MCHGIQNPELFRVQFGGNNFSTNGCCSTTPTFVMPNFADMINQNCNCTPVFHMPSMNVRPLIMGQLIPMTKSYNPIAPFYDMPNYLNGTYTPISKSMFVPYTGGGIPCNQTSQFVRPQTVQLPQNNIENIFNNIVMTSVAQALNETMAQYAKTQNQQQVVQPQTNPQQNLENSLKDKDSVIVMLALLAMMSKLSGSNQNSNGNKLNIDDSNLANAIIKLGNRDFGNNVTPANNGTSAPTTIGNSGKQTLSNYHVINNDSELRDFLNSDYVKKYNEGKLEQPQSIEDMENLLTTMKLIAKYPVQRYRGTNTRNYEYMDKNEREKALMEHETAVLLDKIAKKALGYQGLDGHYLMDLWNNKLTDRTLVDIAEAYVNLEKSGKMDGKKSLINELNILGVNNDMLDAVRNNIDLQFKINGQLCTYWNSKNRYQRPESETLPSGTTPPTNAPAAPVTSDETDKIKSAESEKRIQDCIEIFNGEESSILPHILKNILDKLSDAELKEVMSKLDLSKFKDKTSNMGVIERIVGDSDAARKIEKYILERLIKDRQKHLKQIGVADFDTPDKTESSWHIDCIDQLFDNKYFSALKGDARITQADYYVTHTFGGHNVRRRIDKYAGALWGIGYDQGRDQRKGYKHLITLLATTPYSTK